MFAASEISNIQNKKFVSFAAREIIGSVCVMLLFCSSCSTTKLYYEYETVPENVYLVFTPQYYAKAAGFSITYKHAVELALEYESQHKEQIRTWFYYQHFCIIDDCFVFGHAPYERTICLSGIYVNGMTGETTYVKKPWVENEGYVRIPEQYSNLTNTIPYKIRNDIVDAVRKRLEPFPDRHSPDETAP